jgi:hypothetical protein
MEHKTSNQLITFIVSCSILLASGSAVAAKVYRWVDENGEVHYSESLPPDFEDNTHDELDERGIVRAEDQSLVPPPPELVSDDIPKELPRDASGMQRPKALYSEKEMQQRMDRFLMLRYDSEQEIEDAMNVEIKQLEYDRRLLQNSRDGMNQFYRGQIREAANRQRAGDEVEKDIIDSVADVKIRLESNAQSLAGLYAREQDIKKTFGVEQDRYRYLLETWAEDG